MGNEKAAFTLKELTKAFIDAGEELAKQVNMDKEEEASLQSIAMLLCMKVAKRLYKEAAQEQPKVKAQTMAMCIDDEGKLEAFLAKLEHVHTEDGLQNLFEEYGVEPLDNVLAQGGIINTDGLIFGGEHVNLEGMAFGEGIQLNKDMPPVINPFKGNTQGGEQETKKCKYCGHEFKLDIRTSKAGPFGLSYSNCPHCHKKILV